MLKSPQTTQAQIMFYLTYLTAVNECAEFVTNTKVRYIDRYIWNARIAYSMKIDDPSNLNEALSLKFARPGRIDVPDRQIG